MNLSFGNLGVNLVKAVNLNLVNTVILDLTIAMPSLNSNVIMCSASNISKSIEQT